MNPFETEFVTRQRQIPLILKYGVNYLDEALCGIFPTDMIVIGAATGAGKTQLALHIATQAVFRQKKVKFYALEADPGEMHRRIKYQALADHFFKNRQLYPENLCLTQGRWRAGLLDEHLINVDRSVDRVVDLAYADLTVFTPLVSDFSKRDFASMYREDCEAGFNLIILDHLHYLWFESTNEYQEIKLAVSEIRDLINTNEVPVILMSHLRKADRFNSYYAPSYHELHGSSEISKRANAVITIAAATEIPNPDDIKTPRHVPGGSTWLRICKAREGNPGATNLMALVSFDREKKMYSNHYKPFATNLWGNTALEVNRDQFPRWMESAQTEIPS